MVANRSAVKAKVRSCSQPIIAVAVTDNILDIGKGVGKMREAGDAGTEEYHEMLLDAVTSSNVAEILP